MVRIPHCCHDRYVVTSKGAENGLEKKRIVVGQRDRSNEKKTPRTEKNKPGLAYHFYFCIISTSGQNGNKDDAEAFTYIMPTEKQGLDDTARVQLQYE
jgi:hypothetical protein